MTLAIRRLSENTPPRTLRALDRLLSRVRSKLVRGKEHLAPCVERISEAEGDRSRILVYAVEDGHPVGILDAVLHAPEPGDLTIAQIAVAKEARRRGAARRLVLSAVARAKRRAEIMRVLAAVHPDNAGAIAFWERMGLSATEDRRRASIVLAAPIERISES